MASRRGGGNREGGWMMEEGGQCLEGCEPYIFLLFSFFLRKPTSRRDPFSEPASYNMPKGLDGVMSTL